MLFRSVPLTNYKLVFLTCLYVNFLLVSCSAVAADNSKSIANKCKYCQYLVRTFIEGLNKTERLHFGGGNTDWEERNLGSFKTSESRFVEIMEYVCKKDSKVSIIGQDSVKDLQFNCQTLAEEQEEHLENWFFNRQDKQPDLEKFLCVEELKRCCPAGYFGPKCMPCPGLQVTKDAQISAGVCFGRGNCEGDGSRTGQGKCDCDVGYVGKMCSNCDAHYFPSTQNSTFLECSECFDGCASGCTAEGPKGCRACRTGYKMDAEAGCVDINECLIGKEQEGEAEQKCNKAHEVCINTPGSYYCDCALGYVKRDKASGQEGVNAGDQGECVLDVEVYSFVFHLLLFLIVMKTVRFKLLSCQEFTLDFEDTAQIGDIKKRIEEQVDLVTFPADKQRLIFNGKILEDTDTLDGLKTLDHTKFIVVLSMKKKCPSSESSSTSSKLAEQRAEAAKPTTDLTAEQQAAISSLETMGYPREEVQRALKAAFFNAARAVEYLCTGIPDNIPVEVLEPEMTSEGKLDHLADSAAFQQIREQVNENPAILLQVLQEIAAVNPELMQSIREHPHRFLELLGGRLAHFDPEAIIKGIEDCFNKISSSSRQSSVQSAATPAQQPDVLSSEADQAAVSNLQAFGFPRQLCIEAYFACDKDEILAANYILQRMEEEGMTPE